MGYLPLTIVAALVGLSHQGGFSGNDAPYASFHDALDASFKEVMTRDNFDDTDYQLERRQAGQIEGNTTFDDQYNSMFIDDVSQFTETPSIEELKDILEKEDLFFGEDDEDYKDLSLYSEHPWQSRLLSAQSCPRIQNYGCRSVHWKMPCMKENLGGGNVRYCCPVYPVNVVHKVAHCNCCKCSLLSASGAQCGGCTRRYKWERIMSICRTYNPPKKVPTCEEAVKVCVDAAGSSDRESADWYTFRTCVADIQEECVRKTDANTWIDSHIDNIESGLVSTCITTMNSCSFKHWFKSKISDLRELREHMKCVDADGPRCFTQSNHIWAINEKIRKTQKAGFNNPSCVANVTECGEMVDLKIKKIKLKKLIGYKDCLQKIEPRCNDQSVGLWDINEHIWKAIRGPILQSPIFGNNVSCATKADNCLNTLDLTTRTISDTNNFITCLEVIDPQCRDSRQYLVWANLRISAMTDEPSNSNVNIAASASRRKRSTNYGDQNAPWSEWHTRRHYMHVPKNCYCKAN